MEPRLDYPGFLARESARFDTVMASVQPETPVPTCPDWVAADLFWHLGAVQWLWATVVRDGITGPDAEKIRPRRPAEWLDLLEFRKKAGSDLLAALDGKSPEAPAWTWSDDHTVGFIRRKQAHEALIHRVDAELTGGLGLRTGMDAQLSADGVDEVLRVMYSAIPGWATFTPEPGATLRVRASDTGHTWLITVGWFTGTDQEGTRYDEPDFQVAEHDTGGAALAVIEAPAADLDCWLWHRPPTNPISTSGDPKVLRHFESAIAPGID